MNENSTEKNNHYRSIDYDYDYGKFESDSIGININNHKICSWKPIGNILHYLIVHHISDNSKISIETLKKMIQWSLDCRNDLLYDRLMVAVYNKSDIYTVSMEETEPYVPEGLTSFLHELPNFKKTSKQNYSQIDVGDIDE